MSAFSRGSAVWGCEWRSPDGLFGLALEQRHILQLIDWCTDSGEQETGGILIGRYSELLDLATVTQVTGPPPDSHRGRTFFERGTRGLQRLLSQVWHRKRGYYLGEWHFHPSGDGTPSHTDQEAMETIARSASFNCPEPLLIIVSMRPDAEPSIRVFVYPAGHQTELKAVVGSLLLI